MPTKAAPQITAWSFSRLGDYRNCPQKAKFKVIDKLKEPESDAMAEGTRVHKLAEDYTLSTKAKPALPKELKLFAEEFKVLRKLAGVECEAEWTFTKEWTRTGWFDGNAWLRIKVDAHCYDPVQKRVLVVDHKTGKMRDKDREQLELYALAAMLIYPEATGVDCQLWYLTLGELITENFEVQKDTVKKLRAKWEKNAKPMLTDRKFKPTPNALCRWCHFRKQNGGPCEF